MVHALLKSLMAFIACQTWLRFWRELSVQSRRDEEEKGQALRQRPR